MATNIKTIFKIFYNNPQNLSILVVFGIAIILRIHHLDTESLWMDEIRQTSYYAHPLAQIVRDAASQNQPPLDYWIGYFVHILSNSDFAYRLPAAFFGAGSVAVLMVILSNVSSWPVAAGFGLVFALMPFNLYYSQEARPYAITVFLFLCMYWTLISLLDKNKKKGLIPFLSLLFFSVGFLYSRALSPLVVTVCLLLILILRIFFLFLQNNLSSSAEKRMIMLTGGTLLVALLFYLPSLKTVLAKSARYVSDTSLGLNIDRLVSAAINFDLFPIWQAYVVQSEPITYPLLILVCLSPWLGWKLQLYRKNPTWMLTALLLPIACGVNLFIFQAKSGLPFRPAYASYILPLACILAAVSFHGLWKLAAEIRFVHLTRGLILILAAAVALQTASTATDYKSMRRKPDWRGVATFLGKNYGSHQVLIFDSFSEYGAWEPTYYGFQRYYRGHSPLDSIERIPLHAAKMSALPYDPVFILFQWREYYLTRHSSYPILSVPTPGLLSIDYRVICRDPLLSCKEFEGFSLITLRDKSNNLAHGTLAIIERLLGHVPQGSWTVELHLAAAALARALESDQWHYHLRQAEKLTPSHYRQKVADIARFIRSMDVK